MTYHRVHFHRHQFREEKPEMIELKISDIHVHLHIKTDHPEVLARLDLILDKLDLVTEHTENIMPSLDELQAKATATLAKVTSDTDIDNAVATVVNNQNATIADLKAQLAAAGTDPAKLQALSDTLDNILATDTANAQKVADAVTAGTPV
jgi:septal ring factor EnvC (AmiA/AmiB activator)